MATVRSGDTLSGIAARYGVTLQRLLDANPQINNPDLIYPGEEVNVPGDEAAPPANPPPASGGDQTYTVQSGDTLSWIGAQFGVPYEQIARVNGIADPNLIQVGQQLTIPSAGGSFTPAPAAAAPSDAPTSASYTVQPGDTLSGIGGKFGVSWTDIASANGISNPNRIYPGQVLTIPGATPSRAPIPIGPVPNGSSGGVSVDQLVAIMPNLSRDRAEQLLPYLNQAMAEGQINTPLRKAAFLAQLAHESGGLVYFQELASGQEYEGRTDLGNIYPGDGPRYKGRGPIQLTGRDNYRAAGAALGLDLENNPDLAAEPSVGFRVAQWFWNTRGLNSLADVGAFDAITLRVNGGYNGKASRDAYYARAKAVLGA